MKRREWAQKRGFTLIELIVVILIITVIAALLLPAVMGAFRTAKLVQQVDDMQKLTAALDAFKAKYGIYPPSRIRLREGTAYNVNEGFDAFSLKMLKRIWPSFNPVTTTGTAGDPNTAAVAANRRYLWCVDVAGKELDNTQWTGIYELEGDECLVFFLGGIPQFERDVTSGAATGTIILHGFSKRPNDPSGIPNANIPATLTRESPLVEFDASRLIVRSGVLGQVEPPPGGQIDPTTAGPAQAGHAFPGANPTQYLSAAGGAAAFKLPSYLSIGVDDAADRRPWAYFSAYEGVGYRPDDCNVPSTAGAEWFESADPSSAPSTPAAQRLQCMFLPLRGTAPSINYANCVSPAPNPYTESFPYGPDTSATVPSTLTPGSKVRFHTPNSFQLISTGTDGKYGPGGQVPRSKSGTDNPPDVTFIDLSNTGASFDNVTNVSGSSRLGDFNERQKAK